MKIYKIIFVLFIYKISIIESVQIPNCCPQNKEIFKIISGKTSSRPDQFKCINNNNNNNSEVINGLRIGQQDNLMNIPECEELTFIKLIDQIHVGHKTCLTKWNNDIYAITCKLNNDNINTINMIEKCCPFGKVYNKFDKKCINNNYYNVNIFNRYFQGPTIFEYKPLNCPNNNDIIVEYFSKDHLFEFDGNTLILNSDKGKFNSYHKNSYCLDVSVNNNNLSDNNYNNNEYVVRTCNHPKICQKIPCIRSCCPKYHKFMRINNLPVCVPDDEHNLSVVFHSFETKDGEYLADTVTPKAYGILHGQSCQKYKLNPDIVDDDVHYINHIDGSIHFPNIKMTYDNSRFCMEKYESASGTIQIVTFLCFDDPDNDKIKYYLYATGTFISCGFFFITLLVYMCVPKLRNLPGKILICLVLSLLVAYLGIAIGQMVPIYDDSICASFAYFLYFTLMSAFAWMNVMCFDIWLTFGTTKSSRGMPYNQNDFKRFFLYLLYALVVPALLTTFTICVTKFKLIDESLQPRFGEGRCWFYQEHAGSHLIFFLAPILTLFLINLILFILTLRYCNQVKREIHRMQSDCKDKPLQKKRFFIDRTRFLMNTKLFVVMGITWILEIISSAFYNRSNMFFWIISDISNVLLGIFVFFIFVFKWRVWNAILDRLGIKRKHLPHSRGGTTGCTTSTFAGSTSNLNLMRMKSMESTTSLNVIALNSKCRLSPKL